MRKKIFILLVLLQLVQLAVAAAFNSYYIDNEAPFHYDNDYFNNSLRIGTADFPLGSISNVVSRFQVNLQIEANFTIGDGKQSNAFRHALWQALLTNSFGAQEAIRIGNAHEDYIPHDMSTRIFSTLKDADRMADFQNNIIGRKIVESNKGLSNKQYAELVLKEYKNNGLWIVSGNAKDGYSVHKSKLSQEQYQRAIQVVRKRGNNGLLE